MITAVETLSTELLRARADDLIAILQALHDLDAITVEHITRELLEKTRIGSTVGRLRKHADERVQPLANAIICKWKAACSATTTAYAAAGGGTSHAPPQESQQSRSEPPRAPSQLQLAPRPPAPPASQPDAELSASPQLRSESEPRAPPPHELQQEDEEEHDDDDDDEKEAAAGEKVEAHDMVMDSSLMQSKCAELASKRAGKSKGVALNPKLGDLIFGLPPGLHRGTPSVGDHGVGRIDRLPVRGLDENIGALFLWKDVVDGTPVEARRVEFNKSKMVDTNFISIPVDDGMPESWWPFTEDDFKLLKKVIP